MAGLGRRTHYRKHLTDSVLHDLPEPKPDERIAKVVATRGSNQFDIIVACSLVNQESGSDKEEKYHTREPQLAILPTKFHKLVWLKRNDFVIVQTGEEQQESDEKSEDEEKHLTKTTNKNGTENGGIRYMISHILYKDQIKHLKSESLWPDGDPEFNSDSAGRGGDDGNAPQTKQSDDGIVYADDYYGGDQEYGDEDDDNHDNMLFVNTNRIATMTIQDDDDSSDDSD